MLYLNFTMTSSVDLARYGVSHGKDLGMWGLWYKYRKLMWKVYRVI